MKKIYYLCTAFVLMLWACKHEPILPDVEHLNQDAFNKIFEYNYSVKPSSHNVLGINLMTDTLNRQQLNLSAHINYNHTLEAMRVNQNNWWALPEHYNYQAQNTNLSNRTDQVVHFEIKSKTPQNEVMKGSVLIPKAVPISVTKLGRNNFKLNWTPQRENQRVLIYLNYTWAYNPRLNHAYAVETNDDGEYILPPSVFDYFKLEQIWNVTNTNTKETFSVNFVRLNPARSTIVKQPSTGTEYTVFGGVHDSANFEVEH
jgi:hypothetical protein